MLAAAVTLALAVLAVADVYKSGNKSCSQNEVGRTRSDSTGFTKHWPPPTGYQQWRNGDVKKTRRAYATSNGGGGWTVSSSKALYDNGTFARCLQSGPAAVARS